MSLLTRLRTLLVPPRLPTVPEAEDRWTEAEDRQAEAEAAYGLNSPEALADERDQMTRAADAAGQEATAARREVDRLTRQLADLHARHAQAVADERAEVQRQAQARSAELDRQQARLDFDRRALLGKERMWNTERRQLEADKRAAQALNGALNRELEAAQAELAALRQQVTAPAPTRPTDALGRLSLCLWLREALGRPDLRESEALELAGPEELAGWRRADPTEGARRARVAEVVRVWRGSSTR